MDAEWNILYDKLEKIYLSGAKVVLSKLPIGDVATQYFADRDLFCAGRVQEEDLKRTMMVRLWRDGNGRRAATGASLTGLCWMWLPGLRWVHPDVRRSSDRRRPGRV